MTPPTETSPALAPAVPPLPEHQGPNCERMRAEGLCPFLFVMTGVWMVFVIAGTRMPWQPIAVSDSNSGGAMRQIMFTLGAMIGIRRMIYTKSLGAVIGFHLSVLLLGLWMVASLSYSTDLVLTAKRSTLYIFGFMLLVSSIHMNPNPAGYYMRTVTYVTGGCAWVSIVAHFIFPKNCTTIEERPGLAGIASHPNVLGPCLFMALIVSMGIVPKTRYQFFMTRGCQAGLGLSLLMSNSVTALFACIAGIGFFIYLTAPTYRAGALQVAAVGAFVMVQIIGVSNIKSALFAAAGRDESMSGRDTLWADVFNEGMKSPIFGSGYGAFWYEGRGREITGTWNPRQSHNAYIDVFVDIGVVGLILVIIAGHSKMLTSWFVIAGERGSEQRRAAAAIVSMGTSLCFIGAFGESFLMKMEKYQFFVFIWGMMVLENKDSNGFKYEFAPLDRPALAAADAASEMASEMASENSGEATVDVPGTGTGAPGIGALAPGIGALAPGIGALAPGIGALAPGIGALAPGIGALAPGISEPVVTLPQPAPRPRLLRLPTTESSV